MEDEPEYDIAVAEPSGLVDGSEQRIRDAVATTLRRHGIPSARICVVVVDDARIAELNQTHLGRTGSTDVLAFDLRDDVSYAVPNGAVVDGEIVLSLETALREAQSRGHSEVAETALYAVHGTLHLLGYDDQGARDAARMHAVEDEILRSIGMGTVYGELSR